MAKQSKDLRCSFCGSGKQDTLMLIAGIDAHICEKCIQQASVIVAEEALAKNNSQLNASIKLAKPKDIKTHLDQYVIGQDEAKRFYQ